MGFLRWKGTTDTPCCVVVLLALSIAGFSLFSGCSDDPGAGSSDEDRDTSREQRDTSEPEDTGAGDVRDTVGVDTEDSSPPEDLADSEDLGEPECTSGSECDSGVCREGACVAASCSDDIQNGDESDVDCGGSCEGCSLEKSCRGDGDCASGICSGEDGATCASCREGETRKSNTACGYEDRGVQKEVCTEGTWETDACVDVWFASCSEIAEGMSSASDGTYTIDPDGPSGSAFDAMAVECDMTTDGGGWTRITPCMAREKLGGTLVGEESAATADFDANCRPFTIEQNEHTYHYTFQFPGGFQEFFVEGYKIKNSTSSQNCIGEFTQTDWTLAHNSDCGDVSFGDAAASGPTTSYAKFDSRRPPGNAVLDWPENGTIFSLDQTATSFRIGWGERSGPNPDDEGWYPWWQGSIWVR